MEINVNKFKKYLLEENEKHNLISRKTAREELDKHIEDSIKLLEFISLQGKKVLDIGSGAGFPGMILAIYCQDSKFTLLESDLKKSTFLDNTYKNLCLKNISIMRKRAEELARESNYREKFDCCTSRAVASINVMLEYALPFLKKDGQLFLWKGRNYEQEVKEAQNALEILGGVVEDVYFYNLMEERDRAIIVIRKEEETPEKYPRRTGMPAKRPL